MTGFIESKDNPKIKNALKIANDASYRRKNNVFFASSSKVVTDILRAGFSAQMIFCRQSEYDRLQNIFANENVFIISPAVEDKLSEGKTEDGVYAVFEMRKQDESTLAETDRLLVLEDVQDPGNMGAIMRTALAFGFENVAVSRRCADVYSRKVIRTSMTASVKLNVLRIEEDMADFVRRLNDKGLNTVAACLEGARQLGAVNVGKPVALFIGNEGNGLSDGVIENCKMRLKIPMSDKIESLNAGVSAAVLMWELGKNEQV